MPLEAWAIDAAVTVGVKFFSESHRSVDVDVTVHNQVDQVCRTCLGPFDTRYSSNPNATIISLH